MAPARPIVKATEHIYLVRTRTPETWYAFHEVKDASRPSSTMLAVFVDELAARSWAHSLEMYHAAHGRYPSRELPRRTRSLPWVMTLPRHAPPPQLDRLDVVRMPFADAAAMLTGTGISCRMVLDPDNLRHKIDVEYRLDRAAMCSRLEHDLSRTIAEP